MLDHLSVGQSSQVGHSQINPHVLIADRQFLSIGHFTREGDKPLVNLFLDGDRLDFALQRTMKFDLGFPDLRKVKGLPIKLPARSIRVSEGIIAVTSLESGIARCLTIAYPPEECAKGFIQAVEHIL